MTLDEFWQLLEGLPAEGAEDELKRRLTKLEPDAIASFDAHFHQVVSRSYDWLLWAAAYIMEGGCSDDGFVYFRYGLISRGRNVFEAALADPDSLADVGTGVGEDFISNELVGYAASEAYESKTGETIPEDKSFRHPKEPTGERWDFDDEELCARKLPRLWARFGNQ
jgi:hypothetical protein